MRDDAAKGAKGVVPSPFLVEASALLAASAVTRAGLGDRRACAELSFAALPPHWGFLVFAGLGPLIETLERPWFSDADIALVGDETRLGPDVAEMLQGMRCKLDLDAASEGSIVFPGEPVISAEGPLAQVLLVGALIEAVIGRATQVATSAARLCGAADGDEVVEATVGAADPATRIAIARAAYLGGCVATTSGLAAANLGIPLRATTPAAVSKLCAAQAGPKASGMWGDSDADRWVDLAGDSMEIELALRRSAGERATWLARSLDRHGTLSTRWDLVALQEGRAWSPRLGADHDVSILPGRKLVARYCDAVGRPVADIVQVTSERMAPASRAVMIGALGPTSAEQVRGALTSSPLKTPQLRDGKPAAGVEPLSSLRQRALESTDNLAPSYRRLRSPDTFPVGISLGLYELRAELFARGAER